MFEPVFQNTNRTIATFARLIVIVIGTRRVIASICLARMRRISRSLRSLVSIPIPGKKRRSQTTIAAGATSRAACLAVVKFSGRFMLRNT